MFSVLFWAPAAIGPALETAPPARRIQESSLWLVAGVDKLSAPPLGAGAADLTAGRTAQGLAVFTKAVQHPVLSGYARLYVGRAELALGRADAAIAAARQVIDAAPGGALGDAALWLLADAQESASRWTDLVATLQTLTATRTTHAPSAWFRLGHAALQAGQRDLAIQAYRKVYYEYPLASDADAAAVELKHLDATPEGEELFQAELSRAERLFGAARFDDARKAYEAIRARASGASRSAIDLRLAECDVQLQHFGPGKQALDAFLASADGGAPEAEFYRLSALRGLHRDDEYVQGVHAFVDAQPASPFAEQALNDLATYYILQNDDETAAAVFAEMYTRYPRGAFANRAAWKAGWWAFKNGRYADAIGFFDSAAAAFPHDDYKPSWLYWSARANEQLGRPEAAAAGYEQVIRAYRNSYYGREAVRRVSALAAAEPGTAVVPASLRTEGPLQIDAGVPPANTPLVQYLLAAGLYDDAIAELRWTAAESGTSPMIEATIAYALNRKGELRPGITAMRHALPQFMAAGGEQLPDRLLEVIFPIDYWGLIQKYSTLHHLDPYLVAALVAQESTFQPEVKSSANAWGLMQLLPSTGRKYAGKVGVRRFSTRSLTNPEVNIRIGTAYFADLLRQFGDAASALAAYNAGESRVVRWHDERPGVDRDQFVDDIPYPETQNYVKRILGTAEDYRTLYGPQRTASVRVPGR